MSPHRPLPERPFGLTLVELCVVLSVLAVVALVAIPGWRALFDARRLSGTALQLGADLQWLRTEAVARNLPLRLTLYPTAQGSCYVVHSGNAADCGCDGSGPAHCRAGAEAIKTTRLDAVDRISLTSNVRSLLFDPVHGTTSPTATLRVLDAGGREIRHVVNIMGRVRSCSVGGGIAGYPPC